MFRNISLAQSQLWSKDAQRNIKRPKKNKEAHVETTQYVAQ